MALCCVDREGVLEVGGLRVVLEGFGKVDTSVWNFLEERKERLANTDKKSVTVANNRT